MIRPNYYKCGDLECFDIIRWVADDDFHICNAIKYIFRAGNKEAATVQEDLEKAQTCLIDGKSDKPGVSKRELMKSELPEWKKYLIANLMDLIREEDDEIREGEYEGLINHLNFLITSWEEPKP